MKVEELQQGVWGQGGGGSEEYNTKRSIYLIQFMGTPCTMNDFLVIIITCMLVGSSCSGSDVGCVAINSAPSVACFPDQSTRGY